MLTVKQLKKLLISVVTILASCSVNTTTDDNSCRFANQTKAAVDSSKIIEHPSAEELTEYFNSASEQFSVPKEILMVIAAVETNWTHSNEPSRYQCWGIMSLTSRGGCNTLGLASELLGKDVKLVKSDPKWNVYGAAAVLNDYAIEKDIDRSSLRNWLPVLSQYTCLANPKLRDAHAKTYLQTLINGFASSTTYDDSILITPISF